MTCPIAPDTRLAELVETWLNNLRVEGRLETTTINEYERVLRKLVVPALGDVRLGELSTDRIDAVLAGLGTQSLNRLATSRTVGLTPFAVDVLRRRQPSGGAEGDRRSLRDEERHLASGQQRRATLASDPLRGRT